ncbi:MAG TPA: hypothetical protein VME24_12365 [Alphaproteobacteria bacterium]|nr:hypothetical protein [Alphaproteobacteria bacterium]
MKKTTIAATASTFSLSDFPSGERARLEGQIIERALELWCRKRRARSKLKVELK